MPKFKKSTKQNVKFIDSDELYEKFINKESLLVKIHDITDFDYYRSILEPLYSDLGRSAYDAVFMFKLCLLQILKGGLSEREVIAQAKTNLEYRYFLDLAVDEELPHFTKLGTFRKRLGEEKFQELFDSFVGNLVDLNIITKKQVRYMDATHQLADVTTVSINALLAQACKYTLAEIEKQRGCNPSIEFDLDEKDFMISEVERKERFVALVELAKQLQKMSKEILSTTTAPNLQEAYDILCRIVKERATEEDGKIERKNSDDVGKLASLSDKDATWGAKSKDYQFLGYKHNVTVVEGGFIEVISTHQGHKADEEFYLDDAKKTHGDKIVTDRKFGTLANRQSSQEIGKQLVAPTRKNMKAHLKEQVMDDAFFYNKTEQYKKEIKKRGSLVEGIFGVMKKNHHFARAKFRGIKNVSIQAKITAFVVNLKALVRWYG